MRKTKIIIIMMFILLLMPNNKIKANTLNTNYYLDEVYNEDIDLYYEHGTNNYPNIYGYSFSHYEEIENTINLYYNLNEYNIIINGNGGVYNGEEEIVIGKINHGETYIHNPLIISNYLFEKENYELEGFTKSFGATVVATSDIIYHAKWNGSRINYNFKYFNKDMTIVQTFNEYPIIPNIILDDNYLGWYNEEGFLNTNNLIENKLSKNYFLYLKNDLELINKTYNSFEFTNLKNASYYLIKDDQVINSQNNQFENLLPNTTYSLFLNIFGNEYYINDFKTDITNLDFKYFTYEHKIKLISDIYTFKIKIDNTYVEGINEGNTFTFDNLLPNENYTFIKISNGIETEFSLKTNEKTNNYLLNHYLIKIDGNNYIIKNNLFNYYLNDELILNNDSKIIYEENIKFEIKKENSNFDNQLYNLDDYLINTLNEEITLNYSDNIVSYNFTEETTYYIIVNGLINRFIDDKIIISSQNNYFDYYLIYLKDDNYYSTIINFNNYNINYQIFNNKIIINNSNYYEIYFNNEIYDDEIVEINNLEPNKVYNFKFKVINTLYTIYFKTNNYLELDINDLNIEVSDDYIKILNALSSYKYLVVEKGDTILNYSWFSEISNQVLIEGLKSNKEYLLYIKYGNYKEQLVGEFKTSKTLSNKINSPTKKIEILEYNDSTIKIATNILYEYSIDLINWLSDESELEFNNLVSNKKYNIYYRYKEDENNLYSNYVLGNSIKTYSKLPSIDSFLDLDYSYTSIYFRLLEGYLYYVDGNLVTDKHFYFNDTFEPNSSHTIKVVRIDDNYEYSKVIVLLDIKYLTSEEKTLTITKNHESFIINNNKKNFTYILKDINDVIIKAISGINEVKFNDLNSNTYYKIYIKKDNDQDADYIVEYIKDIYIPNNLKLELINYLLENNINNSNEINDLLEKQLDKLSNVKNLDDYNILYNETINLINEINESNNTLIIIVSTITLVVVSSFTILFIRRRRVKKI